MRIFARSVVEHMMMMMKKHRGHGLDVMAPNAGSGITTGVLGLKANPGHLFHSSAPPAPLDYTVSTNF